METNPLVSIIAINYNQTEMTLDFLRSLSHLSYPNYEVIIVDNASQEDPTSTIRVHFPEVRVIRAAENLGFAGGHNLGMKAARGDFFFNVNNDTEIKPENADLIEQLLAPFAEDAKTGAVSPKIRYFFHPNIIQYAGYGAIHPLTGRGFAIGDGEEDKGQYDNPSTTRFMHGAAMMLSRKVVEKVGMMYEPFFLYYEEMDWSARILKSGYRIYYRPQTVIYHKASMSTGKNSPLKTFYLTRNRLLYMQRNTGKWAFAVFMLYFICATIPVTVVRYLLQRQSEHLQAFFSAIRDYGMQNIIPRKTITTNLQPAIH
ncbi:glycosyltransferase family 2 protein [Rhodoflexus caldus]|uniref:glycosyltransferase family 2 protein n=1 Tax=Rhodoflexus caldus TaxID=2891236 RepID=UPI00202A4761|nr:glycosyltransferase family 2 protein [Rhodoflexus caldus]